MKLTGHDRAAITEKVSRYYTEKIGRHGPNARGVDWNSAESQALRFKQLLKVLPNDLAPFSLNDYGCGYGGLLSYVRGRGYTCFYRGFDVSERMLTVARAASPEAEPMTFVDDETRLRPADYTVASGIFNVRLDVEVETWREYVAETIERLAALSLKAFAFNVLSTSSDPDHRRADLYYADPVALFRLCQKRLSPHVALLHDYGLFEFTVIVRLEPTPVVAASAPEMQHD